jgi:hypothetical protein
MRDFIGINGHTVQFKPELYRPICGFVRDYHPVEWDVGKNPLELPRFPIAKNGVDWSQVYGSWRHAGWNTDACLMFETVPQTDWTNLEISARAYAQAFAREFGPSGKRRLVDSIEIGNEPGKWSDAEYGAMFKAMAQGARAGDPKLKIATCNVGTGQSSEYQKSVSCVEPFPDLFDALSVHTYAQLENWPTWRRSFPEDPKLPHYSQDVEELCRWRDAHAPEKRVWVTEFGYDSTTKPAELKGDFTKWVGVTDEQQAQWLVRSLLVFSAMPVDRAYIYFFNDEDQPRLHSSSGITRHFQPKPAFYALQQLQLVLGEYRFERIVTNVPSSLHLQEYRDTGKGIIRVAWSPTGQGEKFTVALNELPGRFVGAQRMAIAAATASLRPPAREIARARLEVSVEESPVYLYFEKR